MLRCLTRVVTMAGPRGVRPLSHESGARARTLHQVFVKRSVLCGIDPGWVQSHIDSARKNTKGTEKVAPLNKELVAKMVVHDLSKTEQGEEALSCTKSPENVCPSAGGVFTCSKIRELTKTIMDTVRCLDDINSDRSQKVHWKFVPSES